MFKRVGKELPKDPKYFTKKDWYLDNCWTAQEEDAFKDWLIDYLKKNREARQNLMNIPSTNKRFLEGFADAFLLNYGWRSGERN